MGIALSAVLLALLKGRYCGLGTNLINASLAGGTVYAWDWALKLVLTALTLSAGYQGGEVTPLFSIGASLGAAVSGLLGLPAALCAGLGYAAVFGSATNTLIAPTLIAAEVFRLALRALCAHNMCACIRGKRRPLYLRRPEKIVFSPLCIGNCVETGGNLCCRGRLERDILSELKDAAQSDAFHRVEA